MMKLSLVFTKRCARGKILMAGGRPADGRWPALLAGRKLWDNRETRIERMSANVWACENKTQALRARTSNNPDLSTGPLARPFARSLAQLTHLLAPPCLLRSRAPLRSFIRCSEP